MYHENRFLDAIRSGIQRNAYSWEAALSHVTRADMPALQRLLGYTPGAQEPALADREAQSRQREHAAAVVGRVDWRDMQGKNYVSPVKNQGFCGSCVAFGVTAAMESRARIIDAIPEDSSDAPELPDLSPAQLFYCGKTSGYKCFEGWPVEEALQFASTTGVVPEACFPYPDHPITTNDCTPCADSAQEMTIIGDHTRLETPAQMKEWLATRGPAITAFSVYLDLYFYRSGVYKKHDDLWNIHVGGHCVAVIGYDDEKQAWLAKNSWGTGWGDAGFFYIGYNQCGFDALMWGVESFKAIYKTPRSTISSNSPKDRAMREYGSGLSEEQVEMVKSVVGEMMKDKSVIVDTVRNMEGKLREHLANAGASDEDIAAIVNYFGEVENDLKDDGPSAW